MDINLMSVQECSLVASGGVMCWNNNVSTLYIYKNLLDTTLVKNKASATAHNYTCLICKLTPMSPAMISIIPVPAVVYWISGAGTPAFSKMSLV